jgi:glucose/arabinose dehydrogenase
MGRPVGLVIGPEGALYVTDDSAGVVYRLTWEK